MPDLPIVVIDAFADRPFAGNPAAVCVLDAWLPDAVMQAIAAQMNLAETAFCAPRAGGADTDWDLRWFTPTVEVDLCGHATLASGALLLGERLRAAARVVFHTRSGALAVARADGGWEIDLPARPARAVAPPEGLAEALGTWPLATLQARDLVAVLPDAAAVRAFQPDFAAIARLDAFALCLTAAGDGGDDFVCRFFAPRQGIPEDPVTGSAFCTLAPYWAARLGRTRLRARQCSPRGGSLVCTVLGDRVRLAGAARVALRGTLTV